MTRKRPEGTRAPNRASTIYFGTDEKWHGRVTMGVRDDGKVDRRHIERKTEAEVIEAVRDLERQRDSGNVRKPGRWTVATWLAHWVENIAAPSVRPKSLTGYRTAVYNHLTPGIGAHRLEKLQPEHLESLYRRLREKKGKTGEPLRAATIHQVHRTVRTALGEAVNRGHITRNPAAIAKPPRIPHEEIIPFTQQEATRILKACRDGRNGARFVLALTLGLRKGEALALQWRDIDFENRRLIVRRSLQVEPWKHGCGKAPCGRKQAGHCPKRYGGGLVADEVKSHAGRRTIGMPAPLVAILLRHKEIQRHERVRAGSLWRAGDWVFTNLVGMPVHPRTDHGEWKALLNVADVRDARLHDARHTAATMLLVLGVPARAVMDVMGWSHVGMTARYQHVTDEMLTTVAKQVGDLFWAADDRRRRPA